MGLFGEAAFYNPAPSTIVCPDFTHSGKYSVDWYKDFLFPIAVNIIGVFVGVVLALWSNRRSQQFADARAAKRRAEEFSDLREVVLSSVMKDTFEAMRVKSTLASKTDPFLLGIYLELAVWEAAQSQFVRFAPLDERILFSRFFDQVRRLARLLDFYRKVRASQRPEPGTTAGDTADDVAKYLAEVAEDVRLDGVIVVSDHGDQTQKRMLGL
jgi:nitrogen fixation-related uncharacterized protein